MNNIDTSKVIEKLINKNEMVLVYFGSDNCDVCSAIKPKIEEILKSYPKIKSTQVDIEKNLKLSADYNVFTIPAILVFVQGKELIREARYISIQEISNKIARYYSLIF